MTTRLFRIRRSKTSSSCAPSWVEDERINPQTWCFQLEGPEAETLLCCAGRDEAVVHEKDPFSFVWKCPFLTAAHWIYFLFLGLFPVKPAGVASITFLLQLNCSVIVCTALSTCYTILSYQMITTKMRSFVGSRCPNDFLSPVIIPRREGDSDVNLCFLMSNLMSHQKTWKSFARSKKDCKHFKADEESFLLEPWACCALGVVLLLGGWRVGGEASCPPCGLSPLELCPQPLS